MKEKSGIHLDGRECVVGRELQNPDIPGIPFFLKILHFVLWIFNHKFQNINSNNQIMTTTKSKVTHSEMQTRI